MPTDRATFEELVAQLDPPMFVVTTAVDGERSGCLVGFASQVSIDPPRFLACLSVANLTYRVARDAQVLVVHFLPADAEEIAELFGGQSGDEVDKFARCAWRAGPGGAPVLERLENWFAGRILARLDLGDHAGFLLEPIDGEAGRSEAPLTYERARSIEPGHEA